MARAYFRYLVAVTVLLMSGACVAADDLEWLPLLMTDLGGVSVAPLNNITKGRYKFLQISTATHTSGDLRDSRPRTLSTHGIDCGEPRRAIAIDFGVYDYDAKGTSLGLRWVVASNDAFSPSDLNYLSIVDAQAELEKLNLRFGVSLGPNLPSAVSLAAEFICRGGGNPAVAKQLASELIVSGGYSDLKTISCDVKGRGTEEYSFSDSGRSLRLQNGLWQSTAQVSRNTLSYLTKLKDLPDVQTFISRDTGKYIIPSPYSSTPLREGNCTVRDDRPTKF